MMARKTTQKYTSSLLGWTSSSLLFHHRSSSSLCVESLAAATHLRMSLHTFPLNLGNPTANQQFFQKMLILNFFFIQIEHTQIIRASSGSSQNLPLRTTVACELTTNEDHGCSLGAPPTEMVAEFHNQTGPDQTRRNENKTLLATRYGNFRSAVRIKSSLIRSLLMRPPTEGEGTHSQPDASSASGSPVILLIEETRWV